MNIVLKIEKCNEINYIKRKNRDDIKTKSSIESLNVRKQRGREKQRETGREKDLAFSIQGGGWEGDISEKVREWEENKN